MQKIHKDPKFKEDLAKEEKRILEDVPRDSRNYEKAMGYAADALESEHPLYKEYRKRHEEVNILAKEAYDSSKRLGEEILGKYANQKVDNINVYDAKAKDIVSDIASSQMMSDYYAALYHK